MQAKMVVALWHSLLSSRLGWILNSEVGKTLDKT